MDKEAFLELTGGTAPFYYDPTKQQLAEDQLHGTREAEDQAEDATSSSQDAHINSLPMESPSLQENGRRGTGLGSVIFSNSPGSSAATPGASSTSSPSKAERLGADGARSGPGSAPIAKKKRPDPFPADCEPFPDSAANISNKKRKEEAARFYTQLLSVLYNPRSTDHLKFILWVQRENLIRTIVEAHHPSQPGSGSASRDWKMLSEMMRPLQKLPNPFYLSKEFKETQKTLEAKALHDREQVEKLEKELCQMRWTMGLPAMQSSLPQTELKSKRKRASQAPTSSSNSTGSPAPVVSAAEELHQRVQEQQERTMARLSSVELDSETDDDNGGDDDNDDRCKVARKARLVNCHLKLSGGTVTTQTLKPGIDICLPDTAEVSKFFSRKIRKEDEKKRSGGGERDSPHPADCTTKFAVDVHLKVLTTLSHSLIVGSGALHSFAATALELNTKKTDDDNNAGGDTEEDDEASAEPTQKNEGGHGATEFKGRVRRTKQEKKLHAKARARTAAAGGATAGVGGGGPGSAPKGVVADDVLVLPADLKKVVARLQSYPRLAFKERQRREAMGLLSAEGRATERYHAFQRMCAQFGLYRVDNEIKENERKTGVIHQLSGAVMESTAWDIAVPFIMRQVVGPFLLRTWPSHFTTTGSAQETSAAGVDYALSHLTCFPQVCASVPPPRLPHAAKPVDGRTAKMFLDEWKLREKYPNGGRSSSTGNPASPMAATAGGGGGEEKYDADEGAGSSKSEIDADKEEILFDATQHYSVPPEDIVLIRNVEVQQITYFGTGAKKGGLLSKPGMLTLSELDFVIIDQRTGDILFVVEVKRNPADLVFARSQRDRLTEGLRADVVKMKAAKERMAEDLEEQEEDGPTQTPAEGNPAKGSETPADTSQSGGSLTPPIRPPETAEQKAARRQARHDAKRARKNAAKKEEKNGGSPTPELELPVPPVSQLVFRVNGQIWPDMTTSCFERYYLRDPMSHFVFVSRGGPEAGSTASAEAPLTPDSREANLPPLRSLPVAGQLKWRVVELLATAAATTHAVFEKKKPGRRPQVSPPPGHGGKPPLVPTAGGGGASSSGAMSPAPTQTATQLGYDNLGRQNPIVTVIDPYLGKLVSSSLRNLWKKIMEKSKGGLGTPEDMFEEMQKFDAMHLVVLVPQGAARESEGNAFSAKGTTTGDGFNQK